MSESIEEIKKIISDSDIYNEYHTEDIAGFCYVLFEEINRLRKRVQELDKCIDLADKQHLKDWEVMDRYRKALGGNIKRAKRGMAETRGHKCRAVLMLDAIVQSSEQALKGGEDE